MIERKIIAQKIKEFEIEEYITKNLANSGHSHTKLQRTPLGEKIVVHASRPGMIVGRKGQNIKKLTTAMKKIFKLENPQIEIAEVDDVNLDAKVVAERIAMSLERFGSQRFKGIAHKVMQDVMSSAAYGVEILISGKVPSQRSKTWRFYQGYLKKCGDIAVSGVNKAYATAKLKSGVVGIKVSIMPKTTILPDNITISEELIEEVVEEVPKKDKKVAKKKPAKKKPAKKKTPVIKKEKKAEVEVKEKPKVEEPKPEEKK